MTLAPSRRANPRSRINSPLLEFSHGNAKLPPTTMIFSLPAGHTCPGALQCHSLADRETGRITDGAATVFRCYSASQETRPTVRDLRWRNLDRLRGLSRTELAQLLIRSIDANRLTYTQRVRWFEGGDTYAADIRDALLDTAECVPDLVFYQYSKSLHLWAPLGEPIQLPENYRLTASWGGRFDHLIEAGLFPRSARVVLNQEEATRLRLPVDFDDSLAYSAQAMAFAHLVHGTQPAGSPASLALAQRRKSGAFTGYSAKGGFQFTHSPSS